MTASSVQCEAKERITDDLNEYGPEEGNTVELEQQNVPLD